MHSCLQMVQNATATLLKGIQKHDHISVTLYNTGALISINSCLTNAQIILNDYLNYSLMIRN